MVTAWSRPTVVEGWPDSTKLSVRSEIVIVAASTVVNVEQRPVSEPGAQLLPRAVEFTRFDSTASPPPVARTEYVMTTVDPTGRSPVQVSVGSL
jgi:hypothetical protein